MSTNALSQPLWLVSQSHFSLSFPWPSRARSPAHRCCTTSSEAIAVETPRFNMISLVHRPPSRSLSATAHHRVRSLMHNQGGQQQHVRTGFHDRHFEFFFCLIVANECTLRAQQCDKCSHNNKHNIDVGMDLQGARSQQHEALCMHSLQHHRREPSYMRIKCTQQGH